MTELGADGVLRRVFDVACDRVIRQIVETDGATHIDVPGAASQRFER